jgi:hypothetical protein
MTMICLRCGYCCKHYSVVIVDDPSVGIEDGNLIFHEGDGNSCKHLQGSEPGEYSCALHDESWYDQTPCFAYTQIEGHDSKCRRGEVVMSHRKLNNNSS